MVRVKKALGLFADAGKGFIDDNAFKLSASLSYYTVFALGPLLVIIISLTGIFFSNMDVQGRIYQQLNGFVGHEAALQIQEIIKNIRNAERGTVGTIVGSIILFIGATGVFAEIQDSINYIWSVKAKPKKGWKKFLINRLLSFSLIVALGFVLLVSLVISTLVSLLSEKLIQQFPELDLNLLNIANTFFLLVVTTVLFAVIFRVLPDALISWRDAFMGAIVTAVFFLIGKFLIGYYLSKADLGITYGAAASIIIILSWVYYSSLILYYGAEFTKAFALQAGSGIKPKQTAVFIIKKEAKEIPVSSLDT